MKKSLLFLLLTLLGCATLHAYDACIDGIYYNFSGNEAKVTYRNKNYNSYSGPVVIPESVSYNGITYSVTSIGECAFNQCSGLTSITIPESVTSIGDAAFIQCNSLTSITIPNSVTSIGSSAFSYSSNLTSVTIGNSVTSIGESAFNQCYGLTSVVIGNSVTSISEKAFYCCSSLTSITIPNSVTSIGEKAFWGCGSLTSVTIGSDVTSIGNYAFERCSSLTSITIPNSVTSIGERAFYLCTSLTSIIVESGNTKYDSRNNCNAILKTSTNTLIVGCMNTTIPESVTSIGSNAFYGSSGLTSITIPNSVTNIGSSAFSSCTSLTDVYCYAENVPETDNSAFEYSSYSSAILHVPAGSLEAYKTTAPWRRFGQIVPMIFYLTYIVDGEVYKTYEIEVGTSITPEPAPNKEGYTFSGWSEIPETMPAHDVTVTGYFIPNNYSLTYFVDGQVYKTYTVAYGSTITPEPAPTKEGYTFSGWTYIPPTMPATDVVVMGTFTINSYTLTYEVDGEVYKSYTVEYGAAITPEPEPTKEGYTFSGWSEIPTTMPDYDVTVTGTFTKIIIKCATPIISYANGKLTFSCETEGAICHSTITDTDIKSYTGNEVDLTVTYHISVYATKEKYEDSEVATGTLCWIDQQPSTEGIVAEDAVTEVKALPVLIQSNRGTITVQGANEGTEIHVYSINGMNLGSAIATNGLATIITSLKPGTTAIVKIGEKAIKVLIK